MDEVTITVTFKSPEDREHWKKLCKELGYDEHALASRLLTNFITYCEETRPNVKPEEKRPFWTFWRWK